MAHQHWRDYHVRCGHGGASCGCRNAYQHLRQRQSRCPACEAGVPPPRPRAWQGPR
jgi:hypothetical protein